MSENKRYRVFKYIDCEKYGVSDDIAEYTLATFDNHFEAESLCELLNKQDDEIRELQERNDRQRKRLDNLYELILNRDYDGQEELIKELEESEQLLQEEMKLYCR